jgi:hypothetical protein
MMTGPYNSFHHHLSLRQGNSDCIILHSRLPPYQQVIPIPKGWHHALALHAYTEELLSLCPISVHRDHPFDIFHRKQGSTGSHWPHNGNVPDRLAPRPFFRSSQVQSPCLEGTSFESTLALKGCEVGLYRPDGDAQVLGQFSDCRNGWKDSVRNAGCHHPGRHTRW